MCFSSQASFLVAGGLLPLGLTSLNACRRQQRPDLLPLAVSPLVFALQQTLEGLVWLGLDHPDLTTAGGGVLSVSTTALAYLFFAYGFWLVWMPWSILRMEPSLPPPRRRIVQAILVLGGLGGAGLWLPLLSQAPRLQPQVVAGSLAYSPPLLLDAWVNLAAGSSLYAAVIAGPLLLSDRPPLRGCGVVILVAFLVTHLVYGHALTSVWCFFSAVLSAGFVWVVKGAEPRIQPEGSG